MKKIFMYIGTAGLLFACNPKEKADGTTGDFKYLVDEFADLKVMRYQIPEWDSLSLQQKEYIYCLGEAAKYGRDIIWDQHFKYNLAIRKTIENILTTYTGDKTHRITKTLKFMPNVHSSAMVFTTTMPKINSFPKYRKNTLPNLFAKAMLPTYH